MSDRDISLGPVVDGGSGGSRRSSISSLHSDGGAEAGWNFSSVRRYS
jgi:hypothetical protein